MRNILTIKVETRMGIAVITFWAVLFCIIVFRATAHFEKFLVRLDGEARSTEVIRPERATLRSE